MAIISDSMLKYFWSTLRSGGRHDHEYNNSYAGFIDCALPGDNVKRMTDRITNLKSNRYVDRVVIMVGTNDLHRRYPKEEFRRHYDLLVSAVRKTFPVASVFCCEILPRLDTSSISFRTFISIYNAAICDVVKDRALTMIPVPVIFNPYKHTSRADRLHLNFLGVQIMRDVVKLYMISHMDYTAATTDSCSSARSLSADSSDSLSAVSSPDPTTDHTPAHTPLHDISSAPKSLRNRLQYFSGVLNHIVLSNTDNMLLSRVRRKQFIRHSQSSSQVLLFGSEKYVYNRATEFMQPIPIEEEPLLVHILNVVNQRLSTHFNSILVNFYPDSDTILPYHKDDETKLDKSAPIATLSIGATRYMEFAKSKSSNPVHRQQLMSNSLFVMEPSTQISHFHRIAGGGSSHHRLEHRFSLTFRKLTSPGDTARSPSSRTAPTPDPVFASPSFAATAPTPDPVFASSSAPATAPTPDPAFALSSAAATAPTPDPAFASSSPAATAPTPNPAFASSSPAATAPTPNPAFASSSSAATAPTPDPVSISSSAAATAPTPDPAFASSLAAATAPTPNPVFASSSSAATAPTPDPAFASSSPAATAPTPNPAFASSSPAATAPTPNPAFASSSSAATAPTPDPAFASSLAAATAPTPNPVFASSSSAATAPTPDPAFASSSAAATAPTPDPVFVLSSAPASAPTPDPAFASSSAAAIATTPDPVSVLSSALASAPTPDPAFASSSAAAIATTPDPPLAPSSDAAPSSSYDPETFPSSSSNPTTARPSSSHPTAAPPSSTGALTAPSSSSDHVTDPSSSFDPVSHAQPSPDLTTAPPSSSGPLRNTPSSSDPSTSPFSTPDPVSAAQSSPNQVTAPSSSSDQVTAPSSSSDPLTAHSVTPAPSSYGLHNASPSPLFPVTALSTALSVSDMISCNIKSISSKNSYQCKIFDGQRKTQQKGGGKVSKNKFIDDEAAHSSDNSLEYYSDGSNTSMQGFINDSQLSEEFVPWFDPYDSDRAQVITAKIIENVPINNEPCAENSNGKQESAEVEVRNTPHQRQEMNHQNSNVVQNYISQDCNTARDKQNLKAQKKGRIWDKKRRQNLTQEERSKINEQTRIREQQRRQNFTQEEKNMTNEQTRIREQQRRQNFTQEEKNMTNEQTRIREQKRRQNFTQEEKNMTNEQRRIREQQRRQNFTQGERDITNEQTRTRVKNLRQNMTEEEKSRQKQQNKMREQHRRKNMTPLQKQELKEKRRMRELAKKQKIGLNTITDSSDKTTTPQISASGSIQSSGVTNNFKPKWTTLPNFTSQKEVSSGYKNTHSNKKPQLAIVEEFHQMMKEYPKYVCVSCDGLFFRQGVVVCDKSIQPCTWICIRCNRYRKSDKICPSATLPMKLDTGSLPDSLTLNPTETRLVSMRIQFMKIRSLPSGGQRGIRGSVVNVPIDAQESCLKLPRNVSDLGVLKVKIKRHVNHKTVVLVDDVDPKKCIDVLIWLKKYNPLYSFSVLNDDWIQANYNDNHDFFNLHLSDNATVIASSIIDELIGDVCNEGTYDQLPYEHCIYPKDPLQNFINEATVMDYAPGQGKTPLPTLSDPLSEPLSFPNLFPLGKGHFNDPVRKALIDSKSIPKLSRKEYAKHRLYNSDRKFAMDPEFIFFTMSCVERESINNAVTIHLQKSRKVSTEGIRLTAGLFSNNLISTEALINNIDAFRYMKDVKGTPAFWQRVKSDALGMVSQLGTFTWFVTFSFNDLIYSIPAILTLMGIEPTDQLLSDISWHRKHELIRTDPVTAVRMFDRYIHKVISYLIEKKQVLGPAEAYLGRDEFGDRGSPHLHMMLKCLGAPKVGIDSIESIIKYIDGYVTTKTPTPEEDLVLSKLVKLQTHAHTKTCTKGSTTNNKDKSNKSKGEKGGECRFHFPWLPSDRTKIVDADDNELSEKTAQMSVKNKGRRQRIILQRSVGAEWTNAYNETMLRCLRSNIDVQFCTSMWDMVNYLINYATKTEKDVCDAMKDVKNNIMDDDNRNARDKLKSLGNVFIDARSISIQESVIRTTDMPMKFSKPKVIFVPSDMPEERHGMLKSRKDMADLPDSSDDIFMKGYIDRYPSRPDSLKDMCYKEFAANFERCSSVTKSNKDRVIHLKDPSLGLMIKRTSPQIVRSHTPSRKTQPDRYFYSKICLYFPWTDESQILGSYPSLEASFVAKSDVIKSNMHQFEHIDEETLDSMIQEVMEDIVNSHVPNNPNEDNIDPRGLASYPPSGLKKCEDTENFKFTYEEPPITDEDYNEMVTSLNEQQRKIFTMIKTHAQLSSEGKKVNQLIHFISGAGGVGKSFLITAIRHCINRTFKRGSHNSAVLVSASTGVAAALIDGQTIHQLLQLDCQEGGFFNQKTLNSAKRDKMFNSLFKNVKYLIVDEVSMIGNTNLNQIHSRLNQLYGMKGTTDYFGGINIIFVGDLFQIPPVQQSKIFDPRGLAALGINFWKDLVSFSELNEVVRSKGDTDFTSLCHRLRIGVHTDNDIKTLKSRVIPKLPSI